MPKSNRNLNISNQEKIERKHNWKFRKQYREERRSTYSTPA